MKWLTTFIRSYVAQNRPAIFRGAAQHWPAIDKWTDKYLRQVFPVFGSWGKAPYCSFLYKLQFRDLIKVIGGVRGRASGLKM